MARTVGDFCNWIEQRAERANPSIELGIDDRFILYERITRELGRLIMIGYWDWSVVAVPGTLTASTVITFTEGTRTAALPADFGANFVRYSGPGGNRWLCKLVDNTVSTPYERDLFYQSPAQLYDWDLTLTATAPPSWYTIQSNPSPTTAGVNTKQMVADQLVDRDYQIRCLYVPNVTTWAITADSDVPVLTNNSSYLESAVWRTVVPPGHPEEKRAERDYEEDKAALMLEAAQNRTSRLTPLLSMFGYGNTYGGMFPD